MKALQSGQALKLLVVVDGGKDTSFNVPLGGFAEASARLVTLRKSNEGAPPPWKQVLIE